MAGTTVGGGRAVRVLMDRVASEIGKGRYQRGGRLPSTRALATRYGTSQETARRGLKALEEQGLLICEGRAGFRVARVEEDRTACPVAFVTRLSPCREEVQPATAALFFAFQSSGARRGWPFLGAHGGAGGVDAIMSQLRKSNAWGVVCDTIVEELYEAVVRCGLPTVMVNSWTEDSPVSTVLQDNYRGGFLAVEHLVRRGARRIAWVGPTSEFSHSRERLSGARAALSVHGLRIGDDCVVKAKQSGAEEALDKLLGSSDRPEGVLAFGLDGMRSLTEAAQRLNLRISEDFEAVGWIVEGGYEQHYRPMFGGGVVPPAVVWSAGSMAERALALLCEVSDGVLDGPVRLCVPTKLKFDKA